VRVSGQGAAWAARPGAANTVRRATAALVSRMVPFMVLLHNIILT
jgi:hypothetical protein